MSSRNGMPSFALLPAELVRKVYEDAGDDAVVLNSTFRLDIRCNLSIADRSAMCNSAVCNAQQFLCRLCTSINS